VWKEEGEETKLRAFAFGSLGQMIKPCRNQPSIDGRGREAAAAATAISRRP